MGKEEILRRFFEIDAELTALTNRDPQAAIDRARQLVPDDVLDRTNIDMLASGTLIDAGADAHDSAAIEEGITILERLFAEHPQNGMMAYNLANGLAAKVKLITAPYSDKVLQTNDIRRRARSLYQLAGFDNSIALELRARAFTNLANDLLFTYRLVEAYDWYTKAIKLDKSNSVALTGAARVLLHFSRWSTEGQQRDLALAAQYLKQAKADPDRLRELAGEQGYQSLLPLLTQKLPTITIPDLSHATPYQQFVAKHHLALSPTIEGLDLALSRWDFLHIPSVTEKIELGSGIPPLFGMFNVMKADYLTARYLAYMGLHEGIPESGKYVDTLDYARYGVKYSALTLAQRACLDLLDKVAVAVSEYLSLPGDPKRIAFLTRWFGSPGTDGSISWQPEVGAAIGKGNRGLLAISEVASDLGASGFLHPKREARNTSTHRFSILHDLDATPSRPCQYMEHGEEEEFIEQLIETLQLTRAVLLYFVQLVAFNEHLSHQDGKPIGILFAPDHDEIRGEG